MNYPPSPYAPSAVPHEPAVHRNDKRRGVQLVLGIVLFVVSQTLMVIPVAVYATAMGQPEEIPNMIGFSGRSPELLPTVLLCVGVAFGIAFSVGGYLFIVSKVGGTPGNGMKGKRKFLEFILGVGTGIVLIALAVAVICILGGYSVTGIHMGPTLLPALLVAVAMGLGPGFMEEILFRGFGLRILDAWWGWLPALLVTSLTFGLVHITNPEASLFGAFAIALEAGVLLGAAYFLTRRLWLAIGIHTGWNFAQAGIFSSDVSGTGDTAGLLTATWEGPAWLTGGDMGVEASVITIVIALSAGILMLVLARTHGMLKPSVKREQRMLQP